MGAWKPSLAFNYPQGDWIWQYEGKDAIRLCNFETIKKLSH